MATALHTATPHRPKALVIGERGFGVVGRFVRRANRARPHRIRRTRLKCLWDRRGRSGRNVLTTGGMTIKPLREQREGFSLLKQRLGEHGLEFVGVLLKVIQNLRAGFVLENPAVDERALRNRRVAQ